VLYGVLSAYETASTIKDYLTYQKILKKNNADLEEELQSSKIGIEITDNAVLAKVRWNFE